MKKIIVVLVMMVTVLALCSCGAKCAEEGCKNKPVSESEFCTSHICAYYCEDIDSCKIKNHHDLDGKHLPVCYNGIEYGSYCDEHLCDMFYEENRGNCDWGVKYDEEKGVFWACCKYHGCKFCGDKQAEDSDYCSKHYPKPCALDNCDNMVSNYDETYCDDHRCHFCKEKAMDGEDYCKEHYKEYGNCWADDCNNEQYDGSRYCKTHKCKKSGCDKEVNNGYCKSHACSEYRCIYPAVEGSKYCKEHKAVKDGNIKIEPEIGMTYEQVLKSTWGKPDRKNVDEYEWGIEAQWVYKNKGYIYFEDGVVTSIDKEY